MKKYFLILLACSLSSQAFVTPGIYKGKDLKGEECEFQIGQVWFLNNQPHPFNERIHVLNIKFEGKTFEYSQWNVSHPTYIENLQNRVRFEHDYFHEIVATKTGGASLILEKNPEETENGHAPTKIIFINDHYRKPELSIRKECLL